MTAVPIELLRAGDRGWMVDLAPERIPAVVAAVRAQAWAVELEDVVPAARSILFRAHETATMPALHTELSRLLAETGTSTGISVLDRDPMVIPVRYDGEDLADVAAALQLRIVDVIAAHTMAVHRVGFFGFAPGFAYIDGVPGHLELPRRPSPRQRVPAGRVAIAGGQTVVYPGGTPGGWHLIGSTTEVLWDPGAEQPSRLSVGDRVIFEARS